MIKISGSFLYQVGAELRPLQTIGQKWTKGQVYGRLISAENWLETLLLRSVYKLQTSYASGNELLQTIKRVMTDYMKKETSFDDQIVWLDQYQLVNQSKTFETVLLAELAVGPLYLVEPKGGFDISKLTENGVVIFPRNLAPKVPESIHDAMEAARCVAFALPTAAAFHLHRLHELVLRRYYDTVTQGKPRPEKRNIGAYMDALKNYGFKDKKVLSALAGLKNFHRNPVLHPDDRLEDIEEALALLGGINTVITYMLKALPDEPLKLTPPPSSVEEVKAIENKGEESVGED